MKIETSKSNNYNDIQRNKIPLNQNNFAASDIEENDSLPSNFADIFESVLQSDKEKTNETKINLSDKSIEKDESPEGHKIVAEKKDDSDNQSGGNDETNAGLANFQTQIELPKFINENIPVRTILHIADIERIVSAARTQLNENGLPQIVVDLKHSVLEGLQIRLSNDQNGKLIAEFIASSEKVKHIIDCKQKELAELLENRGVQISTIKTSVKDGSANNRNQPQPNTNFTEIKQNNKLTPIEKEEKLAEIQTLKNIYRA